MPQINTRLVLRNDTKAEWEAVKNTATLKVGEVGIETDTGLFKIGRAKENGELCTWGELEYANEMQVRVVSSLEGLVGRKIGDMVIVETPLYVTENDDGTTTPSTEMTRTAYAWQETVDGPAWAALDGNYRADNVYFDSDITLAGSYTTVGNVTKSSNAATGTLSAKGKTLEQVMQTIFTKELYPATGGSINKPSLSISADTNGSTSGEVGEQYTLPTATLKVSDVGAYSYGPATGITFPATKLTLAQGAVSTATNKVSNDSKAFAANDTISLTATDTNDRYTDSVITYTFNASGTYTQGAAPKTNLGTLLDTDDSSSEAIAKWKYRIPAGTATASKLDVTRTGYRYMFAGGTTVATLDSATIRSFAAKKNTKPTNADTALEFYAAGGTTKVVCAFPNGWTGTPYFEMFGLAWGENTNFAARTNVTVADARGNDGEGNPQGGMSYKIYSWELPSDAPLDAESTKFRVWFK